MSESPQQANTAATAPAAKAKACCTPVRDGAVALAKVTRPEVAVRPPTGDIPMVPIPGGTFLMGAHEPDGFQQDGEGPIREVTLAPFEIGRFPVTNAQFGAFADSTGYVTEAERFGSSFVFWGQIAPERFRSVVKATAATAPWWCQVEGACWFAPEGPGTDILSRVQHPVVHISWSDAFAFCTWSGLRLPTEAEWECAARGGLVQKRFPWGDELLPDGRHRCNIWQGIFPEQDTGEDGYAGTCPVDAFPANGFGLYSACGNTWEWCADWFSATHHLTASRVYPQGPASGLARVMKGGSFLCHASYCNRYRVGARSSLTPDSSSANVGFRCAR